MDLRHPFRRGPGRRRLPDAYTDALARIAELEQQLAPVAGLVRYPCPMLGHPPQWSTQPAGDCPWCVAEVEADIAADLLAEVVPYRTAALNAAAVHVDAVADVPGSCFAVPTVVHPETELRIVGIPPGPVDCEAADVDAPTRQTDVRQLRQGLAVMNAGPVRVTWDGGLSTRPPLPDETPTERLSAVTAVLPVWDRSIRVPVELSKDTGERARDSVRAALTT